MPNKQENNIDKNVTGTLQRFLGTHKDSYFIIGGHAAAYNLSLVGLSFRITRDYDIVIVSEVIDSSFANDLVELLKSGGYKFGYKASTNKRIAYRFESPSDENYPEVIEFFIKEKTYVQSLDNRFAKLDIVVDDDKISAMVLNGDIYDFSKRHVIEINQLMFVDKPCLVALKSYAYFENEKLYKDKKVSGDDYIKHCRDILRILGSFTPEELMSVSDLPQILRKSLEDIVPILVKSKQRLKEYGLTEEFVFGALKKLLNK